LTWAFTQANLEDQLFSILSYTAAARVAAHHGGHEAAQRHVGSASRLNATPSPAAFPWLAAQVALTLGHILLDLGDVAAASFRAEKARRHLTHLLTDGVLGERLRRLTAAIARHRRAPPLPERDGTQQGRDAGALLHPQRSGAPRPRPQSPGVLKCLGRGWSQRPAVRYAHR
jgi:hypothetical protein